MDNNTIERKYKKTFRSGSRKGHNIIGILFIVAGLFLFIHSSGWIPPAIDWSTLTWPLVLVVTGLFFTLWNGKRDNRGNRGADTTNKTNRHTASHQCNVPADTRRT